MINCSKTLYLFYIKLLLQRILYDDGGRLLLATLHFTFLLAITSEYYYYYIIEKKLEVAILTSTDFNIIIIT